jgi:hypothetical protein
MVGIGALARKQSHHHTIGIPAEISARNHRGIVADVGAHLRVPGGKLHHALVCRGADCGADSHPGLFQLQSHLPPDAQVQSAAQRRLARSLIGAGNFFELAVAVAITLFGPSSSAALACVVGALVEVPVMLSVCRICNQSRGWYQATISENQTTN